MPLPTPSLAPGNFLILSLLNILKYHILPLYVLELEVQDSSVAGRLERPALHYI